MIKTPRALAAALFTFAFTGALSASIIAQPQASYGHVDQANITGCTSDTGINNSCGPTSLINSYYWLQNAYPAIYGNLLIPHGPGNTPLQDQQAVADYLNCVSSCSGNGGGTTLANLYDGDQSYIESVDPGVTYYTISTLPTYNYLFGHLTAKADVELLVGFYTPNGVGGFTRTGGHYVTVTGISSPTNDGNGTFNFVDPNGGTNFNNVAILYSAANNYIYTTGNVYGTGQAGDFTIFEGAITENAIPEPGTIALGAGALLLFAYRKRK